MHELAVTQGILKICLDESKDKGFNKINEIRINVGELTGLIPSCIEYYFNIISKDTVAEGAKIIVHKIPIEIKCKKCGFNGVIDKGQYTCSNCQSNNIEIVNGREFYVDSLEVDDGNKSG